MSRRELLLRTGLGAAVALVACLAYRSLQFHFLPGSSLRTHCPGWDLLPFHALWLWPYLSMFVLVGLPWFLLAWPGSVLCFARRLLATAAVGWVCFALFPTACLRPSPEGHGFAYGVLLSLDAPNNCMPCLHSAMALLAALALARDSRAFSGPVARLLLAAWVMLISLSIVALRQHTDLDTVAGLALGAIAGLLPRAR
jgi:membrane-associated phospholipid phosphatase